jgi:heme-degrading monooxygenase HmoA
VIERIWHGWTEPADADDYERLLEEEILPGFADQDIDGYRGVRVLRRSHEDEVEFVTIMRFESVAAVEQFAREEYERAHVSPAAQDLLARFDDRAHHYELRAQRSY